jgi:hypothetical protein
VVTGGGERTAGELRARLDDAVFELRAVRGTAVPLEILDAPRRSPGGAGTRARASDASRAQRCSRAAGTGCGDQVRCQPMAGITDSARRVLEGPGLAHLSAVREASSEPVCAVALAQLRRWTLVRPLEGNRAPR